MVKHVCSYMHMDNVYMTDMRSESVKNMSAKNICCL